MPVGFNGLLPAVLGGALEGDSESRPSGNEPPLIGVTVVPSLKGAIVDCGADP
jgi:hypothetical protein